MHGFWRIVEFASNSSQKYDICSEMMISDGVNTAAGFTFRGVLFYIIATHVCLLLYCFDQRRKTVTIMGA